MDGDVVALLRYTDVLAHTDETSNSLYSLSRLQPARTGIRPKTGTAALRATCYCHWCCWPSGDCCECTCIDGPYFSCGAYGFNCIDPTSGCIDPIATQYPNCPGWLSLLGNGYCSQYYNNELCGYDLGKKHWEWYECVTLEIECCCPWFRHGVANSLCCGHFYFCR